MHNWTIFLSIKWYWSLILSIFNLILIFSNILSNKLRACCSLKFPIKHYVNGEISLSNLFNNSHNSLSKFFLFSLNFNISFLNYSLFISLLYCLFILSNYRLLLLKFSVNFFYLFKESITLLSNFVYI